MPGKTIGIHLEPLPEIVWENYIVIPKLKGKYAIEYRIPKPPDHPEARRIDDVIRRQLGNAIRELNGE